jgi:hypothetical protein
MSEHERNVNVRAKSKALLGVCDLYVLIHTHIVPLQWLHSAVYGKHCSYKFFSVRRKACDNPLRQSELATIPYLTLIQA